MTTVAQAGVGSTNSKYLNLLCVDDEPLLLEGLALTLRRHFNVLTATSADQGMALLKQNDCAVVFSDMRMPGKNGAAFLTEVRAFAPTTVRVLLTGQTDLEAAVSAINDGQIFRFLTKPCPPALLLAAAKAAEEQYRLIKVEQELLEQTLMGAVRTLTDVLSTVQPLAFGRATRVKNLLTRFAPHIGLVERWPLEIAASLSALGAMSLPPALIERSYYGQPVSAAEQLLLQGVAAESARLIGSIPRLEKVCQILLYKEPVKDPLTDDVMKSAALLRLVTTLDVLETQGVSFDKPSGPLAEVATDN